MSSSPAARLSALALFTHLLALPAVAQIAAIGLSSVRSQTFESENLLFYAPEAGERFAWSLAAGDFNGDGVEDLATGMPYDDGLVGGGLTDSGIVIVRYGVAGRGLAGGIASTVLSQGSGGSPNPAESGDFYGFALASGDFNGDGIDDLAVGAPSDRWWVDEEDDRAVGSVDVHYGSTSGIPLTASHHIAPATFDGDRWGESLAVGNFDGDLFDDLAVGSPGYHSLLEGGFWWQAGAVYVLHGQPSGLLPWNALYVSQDVDGVEDWTQHDEEFGYAVAAGDFNDDGYDDLAVGIPAEEETGAVQVILGSAASLDFGSNAIWRQSDLPGGSPDEIGDRFGQRLAAGDFDGDGRDDLAISAPSEDLGPGGASPDAGEVTVMYGAATESGFALSRTDHFRQSGIFGSDVYDQAGDTFGLALAAGDFDGDGHDDLAIGQPGEDVGGANRGGVTLLMGGQFGLYERFRFVAAGINGVPPGAQNHSDMGRALAAGDFDASGTADLAIGIPFRTASGFEDAGAETILYGSMFGDGFESGNTLYWAVGP